MGYIAVGNLAVDAELLAFVNNELLATNALATNALTPDAFWEEFAAHVEMLAPINRALLKKREALQQQIDTWLINHRKAGFDKAAYEDFLRGIGYLVPVGGDFTISTQNVDAEIASIAGPQLVVPVMNARYAINAANARWGSLYDALYGTDVIPETKGATRGRGYNPVRGAEVIAFARRLLDEHMPLQTGSWSQATGFTITDNDTANDTSGGALQIHLDDKKTGLAAHAQFTGYSGMPSNPSALLLSKNGLHLEIRINQEGTIGSTDNAFIDDIRIESAISTIMDCEDSVAAVDAEDKVLGYRNWLGLMRGDLSIDMYKGDKEFTRRLNEDKQFTAPDGSTKRLHGRALMLVRNVGHLMTNPAILLSDGTEIPEGIMDAFMTVLGALPDFQRHGNSRTGSIYIVKPKMHGPEEVAFAGQIFSAVETLLGLPHATIKMGIMDEERRTTINLKECIRAAKDRVVFINTGFLDRTGDEIHTSMEAGPMIRKEDMREATWIEAYEDWNVETGLACGFSGRAQIGKGMWAMPDLMADMLDQKSAHPQAGANCAWVPSPTAASLHAIHYLEVDVFARQAELASGASNESSGVKLSDILTVPIAADPNWTEADIHQELQNNAQGLLGYVKRWIDDGIGCSKVPDIHNVGLMEDRATLRISSQHMANWLHHGVCDAEQIMDVMKQMAAIVDDQNKDEDGYQPIGTDYEASTAFQAACDLVFEGQCQPSGYTEPILHRRRLQVKAQ